MEQKRKVIHVELNKEYQGKRHWYFGSVAAIYDVLTLEVVGIAKASLWNVLKNGEYKSREAIIRYGVIHSKKTNRGNYLRKEAKQ